MKARVVGASLIALALAVAGAACGGGESDSLSSESQAAIKQIEGICDDASAQAAAAQGKFPVADFDAQDPSPADLPKVGAYFSIGHAIWDKALVEARGVSVPSEIQMQVDTLLDSVESDLALAKKQAAAAKAADVEGFTATLDDVDSSRSAVEAAADDLGVDCAY
jgi:hypothetical protein